MGMIYNPQTMRYEYIPEYTSQNMPKANSPTNNQGLLWVSGEVGAKSWVVPPNNTVLLMDSETNRFYIKSSDNAGMPTIKTYEYKEIVKQEQQQPQIVDNSNIVVEIDNMKSQIAELTQKYESLTQKQRPKKEKEVTENE